MPDWKTHIKACNKVKEKIKISNVPDFKFGSILIDYPWINRTVADQLMSDKSKLHYYIAIAENDPSIPNYYKFLRENYELVSGTDYGKGMLLHLILDAVVNTQFMRRTTEYEKDRFNIETYSKLRLTADSIDKLIDLKYRDIHGYEDDFGIDDLYSFELSIEAINYIYSLGCEMHIDALIDKINSRLKKFYYTRNLIFTMSQYEKMIDDTVAIFIDILNKENWL